MKGRAIVMAKQVEAHFLRGYKAEALTEQAGCCKYCFAPLTGSTATADHVRPRSKGGTSMRRNIVAACVECNAAKGSMPVGAFNRAIRVPEGHGLHIWRAWSRRRIWLATHRACRNIGYSVGIENTTPVGRRAA
jgi:hypothetical protein